MSGFPSLQPAMTVSVKIDPPVNIGSISKGTPLVVVPIVGGSIESHVEYSLPIDASFVGTGADYIRNDPSGKHMRLDAHFVAKDKSGALIYANYTGIVALTDAVSKVLSGHPDAKTTEFGDAFIEMRFETGDQKYSDLVTATFVGSGRFRLEEGASIVVEYKLSKVVA